MSLFRFVGGCALVLPTLLMLAVGCASSRSVATTLRLAPPRATFANSPSLVAGQAKFDSGARDAYRQLIPVDYEQGSGESAVAADDRFIDQPELSLTDLIAAVRARNPSLQAALAAWGAAAEKYSQAVALEDPMFQSMFAPGSFGSSNIQSSYYLGIAQKIPWSGKRELRGHMANWETVASSLDYAESQQRIEEATRLAYFDYYLVQRQWALTETNMRKVEDFRSDAKTKFEATQVPYQDVLQADLELAKLEQRQIDIEQMRQVAVARINTLLHRSPELPLPPPPSTLEIDGASPDRNQLLRIAVESRPDLSAVAARLQAEQNAVALACKEFYPDFEFMGRYDAFWTDVEQRGQVGMNMNVPLNRTRRRAAVREAMFRANKLQAEYDQLLDTIRNDVAVALAGLNRSRNTVRLYSEKTIPAAESNLSAATAGYTAGTIDFLRLVAAQRELIDVQENYQEALVDYHRRKAELRRAIGSGLDEFLVDSSERRNTDLGY